MAAMFEGWDAEVLARVQFAFTMSFHIVFPAFSIGLASYLAVLEALWLWTGREVFINLFDYWLKIFAVAFGMGVVSGIVMVCQFGTIRSGFVDKAGPVIGPLMAYEVFTVAALLTAAVVAGLSAIVVAIQKRSARGRSSSQTAFADDATRTPDAAAAGAEREEPCSA
jgi:cytochrome bd-type quinol oxidase subunit 1